MAIKSQVTSHNLPFICNLIIRTRYQWLSFIQWCCNPSLLRWKCHNNSLHRWKASQFLLWSVMSSNWPAATHTLVICSNLVHNMLGTKKGEKNQSNKVGKERMREREKESVPKASKNNSITFVVVVVGKWCWKLKPSYGSPYHYYLLRINFCSTLLWMVTN